MTSVRSLLFSSSIGSLVEWYDFFVFASAAALVFDRVFFPAADPLNGVLLSLMTYAIGFVTRPLGGLVFGVLGDRYGRKRILVFTTFFIVYVTRVLHQPRTLALEAAAVGSIADVVAIFAAGALSDRVGRLPVTAFGLIGAAAWSFILFPAMVSGSTTVIMAAAAVGGVFHGIIVGGMSAFFVELFPTETRYTGFSIGYQFATVFTGALAPLIGVALLNRYGSTIPVSLYAAAMAAPGLAALGMAGETKGRDLAV